MGRHVKGEGMYVGWSQEKIDRHRANSLRGMQKYLLKKKHRDEAATRSREFQANLNEEQRDNRNKLCREREVKRLLNEPDYREHVQQLRRDRYSRVKNDPVKLRAMQAAARARHGEWYKGFIASLTPEQLLERRTKAKAAAKKHYDKRKAELEAMTPHQQEAFHKEQEQKQLQRKLDRENDNGS